LPQAARALLQEYERRLKAEHLRLCMWLDNDGVIRLYEQEGYLRVGTWTKSYNDGGDALVMEKGQ
jgi:ribosomal protein S18 acetylase RimI-like enzyme